MVVFQQQRLVSTILHDHFGANVQKVGVGLHKRQHQSLKSLSTRCSTVSLSVIKEALLVLMQHGLVTVEAGKPNGLGECKMNYTLIVHRVILRLRYPLYISQIKMDPRFGREEEHITMHIFCNGQATKDDVLNSVLESNLETECDNMVKLRKAFARLVSYGFLKSHQLAPFSKGGELSKAIKSVKDKNKRKREEVDSDGEDSFEIASEQVEGALGVYRINPKRFHAVQRGKLVALYFKSMLDDKAGVVVENIMDLQKTTGMSEPSIKLDLLLERFESLTASGDNEFNLTSREVESYVRVIASQSGGILTLNDTGSSKSIVISTIQAKNILQRNMMENIVSQRYDQNGTDEYKRVFRCLANHHNLDQQQISHYCVIPLNAVCSILAKLMHDGLITTQEIPKLPDFSKSILLYSYSPERTRKELVEYCYKTMSNILTSKNIELKSKERLLERLERGEYGDVFTQIYKGISINSSQQNDEEANISTTEDRIAIANLNRVINKISASLRMVDRDLFILKDAFDDDDVSSIDRSV